jgi:hypothetical protein
VASVPMPLALSRHHSIQELILICITAEYPSQSVTKCKESSQ